MNLEGPIAGKLCSRWNSKQAGGGTRCRAVEQQATVGESVQLAGQVVGSERVRGQVDRAAKSGIGLGRACTRGLRRLL